ncbi:UHRF1-binding protein 1-like [Senna tora]|uniref:UHRF1-binding protein 1-like n=1 Tax=Senna tora TaxID=362788 RepID=A0A834SEM2_9FABA|nr:UHRF1-binding protein 1-like [Senna tora]
MGGGLYLMRRGRKKKRMSPPWFASNPTPSPSKALASVSEGDNDNNLTRITIGGLFLRFQNYSLGRVSGFLPFPVT